MIFTPEQYSSISVYDLLVSAARGHIGVDHAWLRAILDRGDAAVPELLRFLTEEREGDRLDLDEIVLDIARQLRTPATVPVLAEFARQCGFDFDDELIEAYVGLGADAIEPLLELYREAGDTIDGEAGDTIDPEAGDSIDPEAGDTIDICFTLAALGVRDPRILDVLAGELKANPFEAALYLGQYGDPAAAPAIQAALAETQDEDARRQLELALARLGKEEREQPAPYDIWLQYPEQEPPRFSVLEEAELVEFLNSPVGDYRAQAARALGFDELAEVTRERLFDMARNDSDAGVRGACWEALETVVVDQSEIANAMRTRLSDPATPALERGGLLVGLSWTAPDDPDLRRAIIDALDSPELRAKALAAITDSDDRRFAEYVPRYIEDADPAVRQKAIVAVGRLGIVSQLKKVEDAMDDAEVRFSALYAYALAAPGETSPARMRKLFRKIEDLAGGLSEEDAAAVSKGLDDRLEMHGYEQMFLAEGDAWDEDEEEDEEPAQPAAPPSKVGRNDPCPCGSGKKYKKCCGA